MNREALLEIGSEELPASFIAPGLRQLKSLAEESLKASGLTFTSIDTYGTPRRLAVAIHGLLPSSPDQKKIVTGPPAAIAKDAQGQWTAAALGFARKQGLKPSELDDRKRESERHGAYQRRVLAAPSGGALPAVDHQARISQGDGLGALALPLSPSDPLDRGAVRGGSGVLQPGRRALGPLDPGHRPLGAEKNPHPPGRENTRSF